MVVHDFLPLMAEAASVNVQPDAAETALTSELPVLVAATALAATGATTDELTPVLKTTAVLEPTPVVRYELVVLVALNALTAYG